MRQQSQQVARGCIERRMTISFSRSASDALRSTANRISTELLDSRYKY